MGRFVLFLMRKVQDIMETITVKSKQRCELIDITSPVKEILRKSGIQKGIAVLFVPHTTAGITINENADPDVVRDLLFALERAVPNSGFYHGEAIPTPTQKR